MKKERRNRIRFDFWLDVRKDDELLLTSVIDELKAAKGFVSAIRQGLMLVYQLQHRDTTLLYELFPWLKQQTTLPLAGGGGHSELAKEIAAQIVLIGAAPGYRIQSAVAPVPEAKVVVGKQITAPNFAMPVFEDDDELTVIVRASTDTNSSLNFVTALKGLQ